MEGRKEGREDETDGYVDEQMTKLIKGIAKG